MESGLYWGMGPVSLEKEFLRLARPHMPTRRRPNYDPATLLPFDLEAMIQCIWVRSEDAALLPCSTVH
jgi:hypothetical protein